MVTNLGADRLFKTRSMNPEIIDNMSAPQTARSGAIKMWKLMRGLFHH